MVATSSAAASKSVSPSRIRSPATGAATATAGTRCAPSVAMITTTRAATLTMQPVMLSTVSTAKKGYAQTGYASVAGEGVVAVRIGIVVAGAAGDDGTFDDASRCEPEQHRGAHEHDAAEDQ